jgi:hypothetical protein
MNPWVAVATETVTVCGALPVSATELGDTEHVDIAGPPLQLSETFWEKPLVGAMARE